MSQADKFKKPVPIEGYTYFESAKNSYVGKLEIHLINYIIRAGGKSGVYHQAQQAIGSQLTPIVELVLTGRRYEPFRCRAAGRPMRPGR